MTQEKLKEWLVSIYIYIYILVFPPVQRTGEQRFFMALTNYYSERTTKIKTYNALVRQIRLCCHHQNKRCHHLTYSSI
jgi:hypothetical protein